MKLKLNPSNRIDRRYLLIKADNRDIVEKIILDYVGILGWAKSNPFFVKSSKGETVLSVDRRELENIKAAFELTKDQTRIIKISGTLKGLGRNI